MDTVASRRWAATVLLGAAAAASLVACGSNSTSDVAGPGGYSMQSSTGNSQQVEVNPPGDIPDDQAFVRYRGPGYSVTVPEGWARARRNGGIVFTDKYNSVTVVTAQAPTAPTPAIARSRDLPMIKASARGFTPGTVRVVHRTAGTAVLITYRALSTINPVTGKVTDQAVERYEFWRRGREVVVTLAAPVGSDNVDPWRTITDSFSWG